MAETPELHPANETESSNRRDQTKRIQAPEALNRKRLETAWHSDPHPIERVAQAEKWLDGRLNEQEIKAAIDSREKTRKELENQLIEAVASHVNPPARLKSYLLPVRMWFDASARKSASADASRDAKERDAISLERAKDSLRAKINVLVGVTSDGQVRYGVSLMGLASLKTRHSAGVIDKLLRGIEKQERPLVNYSETLRMNLPAYSSHELESLIRMVSH